MDLVYDYLVNPELLEHARKREIEVKLLELSDAMEDRGYPQTEIDLKVAELRKQLEERRAKESAADKARAYRQAAMKSRF